MASMPMSVDQAIDIFELVANYLGGGVGLDDEAKRPGNFTQVERVCAQNGADQSAVKAWLTSQGARCDAEVNKVDATFERLVELDDDLWAAQIADGIKAGKYPLSYNRFLLSDKQVTSDD